jgi:hypothetical protein
MRPPQASARRRQLGLHAARSCRFDRGLGEIEAQGCRSSHRISIAHQVMPSAAAPTSGPTPRASSSGDRLVAVTLTQALVHLAAMRRVRRAAPGYDPRR